MPKISAPPSVFAKALTLLHQLLGFFTSSAAFLSYSVVSPIRFSISICSDHLLREISVLLLYNFTGAVCNRKLYSPVLSCTHHGKIPAAKSGFVCFADKIGLVFSFLVFYLFGYLFVQAFPVPGETRPGNACTGKAVLGQKSLKDGEFGAVYGWADRY